MQGTLFHGELNKVSECGYNRCYWPCDATKSAESYFEENYLDWLPFKVPQEEVCCPIYVLRAQGYKVFPSSRNLHQKRPQSKFPFKNTHSASLTRVTLKARWERTG